MAAYKVGNFTTSGYELTAFAIPYGALASAPVATISGTGLLSWTPVTGAVAYKGAYSAEQILMETSLWKQPSVEPHIPDLLPPRSSIK